MGVNTTIEYECDGCGMTSDRKDFHTGFECGNAEVSINGNKGAKTFVGDWGGTSYKGEYYLCFQCGVRVRDFITKTLKEGGAKWRASEQDIREKQ